MPEKILIRKDPNTEELFIYVPTLQAPKGYIKRWNGSTDYDDISLEVYKQTRDCDEQETNKTVRHYVKVTGKREPKIGARLPRDYQKTGTFEGDYFLKGTPGGVYVIEDAKGVLIRGYTSPEAALVDLEKLKQGKPI